MSGRWRGRLALLGWLVAVAAAGTGLRWAGDGALASPPLTDPGTWGEWLASREPVVAAVSIVRLLALAGLWYLVGATVVGMLLRLARADGLVKVADRLTVAPVRRLLVTAVGLSFASGLSPVLAVARASPAPSAVVSQLTTSTTPMAPVTPTAAAVASSTSSTTTGGPPPTLTMRLLPPPADGPAPVTAQPASGPVDAPATAPAGRRSTPTTWAVKPGECFWSIAEEVLGGAWGRAPTDAEIVPYWHTLIERNRSQLADRHNPHLIFPGQVFTVPTPSAAP